MEEFTWSNWKEIIEQLSISYKVKMRLYAVIILVQINQNNLLVVIHIAPANTSIHQMLAQYSYYYIPTNTK